MVRRIGSVGAVVREARLNTETETGLRFEAGWGAPEEGKSLLLLCHAQEQEYKSHCIASAILTAVVNAQIQDALVYVPQYSRTHYPSSVVALRRLVRTAVGFLAC